MKSIFINIYNRKEKDWEIRNTAFVKKSLEILQSYPEVIIWNSSDALNAKIADLCSKYKMENESTKLKKQFFLRYTDWWFCHDWGHLGRVEYFHRGQQLMNFMCN